MNPAELMNKVGGLCQDKGHLGCARVAYAGASVLAPGWSAAWFNRGLVAKQVRCWEGSRAFNGRAARLAPDWQQERTVGVAAGLEEEARSRVAHWAEQGPGRHLEGVECIRTARP